MMGHLVLKRIIVSFNLVSFIIWHHTWPLESLLSVPLHLFIFSVWNSALSFIKASERDYKITTTQDNICHFTFLVEWHRAHYQEVSIKAVLKEQRQKTTDLWYLEVKLSAASSENNQQSLVEMPDNSKQKQGWTKSKWFFKEQRVFMIHERLNDWVFVCIYLYIVS